ncbi:YggS family pyridoxal phosphate-dependent enzyme [Geitlerinema sp. PCC 9228]|jgi:hypothetical protein|uniref:YggS family pyridoxal phosphate-dependent enzyme n=1 Tax=Geitlerinema sp. PCC 9228 TaxID=111611 RepID=UPI0008F9D8A2|nr:YggS family pyridoxal phosphate-dependent enzyme [Geitlerinema sp. PCC 9228]
MSQSTTERIAQVRQTLPPHVQLVAVTKYVDTQAIRTAYHAGIRDFGESRVQDAQRKQQALADLEGITWHLIGHLQSNKAKKAIEHFDWIHSVDSLKLAQRLDKLAAEMGRTPQVCLQVKVRPDPQKYGWEIDELLSHLPALDQCHSLQIMGLMTILPQGLNQEQTRASFQRLSELAQTIRERNYTHISMKHLSMGMSADYHLAVEAGATMVRLGHILFADSVS